MPFDGVKKIWMNGQFVDFADAKIHVLSHVIHYGSGVFEGVRCYKTKQGPAIFRLKEHTRRLFDSAKIYRMEIPFTQDEFNQACIDIVVANGFEDCYLRPLVYRGFHSLGVYPGNCPVDVMLAAWAWGKYLGPEAIEHGVDVRISSWTRMAPNTFPAMAKATANYMNSQLIRMEAEVDHYAEGIALDINGYLSEGSGENLFVVRDGMLYTPPLGSSVLPGITRDCIMKLSKDLGLEVAEKMMPREFLYIADEVFFTGTAAEVTPIRSVDRVTIGAGGRGPITEKLQSEFFSYLAGDIPDRHNWLTHVKKENASEVAQNIAAELVRNQA